MKISCQIGYLKRLDLYKSGREKPFSLNIPVYHIPGARQSNLEYEWVEDISVTDIRGTETQFSLDIHGFEVVPQRTPYVYDDFEDTSVISRTYVKYMEAWMKERLRADEVLIFDHQVRRRNPIFAQRRGDSDQPIRGAHVGQRFRRSRPGKSVINLKQMRLRKAIKRGMNSSSELKASPSRALSAAKSSSTITDRNSQVRGKLTRLSAWRPLFGPCEDLPLAFCDYRSVKPDEDFEETDIVYPNLESESFSVYHNKMHKWYFLSRMMPDEVILLKQADTKSELASCRTTRAVICCIMLKRLTYNKIALMPP